MNPFKERKDILRAMGLAIGRRKTASDGETLDQEPTTCQACGGRFTKGTIRRHHMVCPDCGFHGKIGAKNRIAMMADPGTFRELSRGLLGPDPLTFPGYREKLQQAQRTTGLKEAVVTGTCAISGTKTVLVVMDSRFLMASMGMAVGEKITRAFEYATKKKLPVVLFAASGGARMQEGILSLMQMAKTSAAVARHDEAGLLYLVVMTHPTTGGVTASFASLGDITLAEPGALIGFAGPRVIQQTIGETLPEGFQRGEFQREHGFVDMVVPREKQRDVIGRLLKMHQRR